MLDLYSFPALLIKRCCGSVVVPDDVHAMPVLVKYVLVVALIVLLLSFVLALVLHLWRYGRYVRMHRRRTRRRNVVLESMRECLRRDREELEGYNAGAEYFFGLKWYEQKRVFRALCESERLQLTAQLYWFRYGVMSVKEEEEPHRPLPPFKLRN